MSAGQPSGDPSATIADGGAVVAGTGEPATPPVAEVPALGDQPAAVAPDNPRTGEPRRPVVVLLATVLCWLAVAVTGVSLLWTYWNAVTDFAHASWLMRQFVTTPGSLERVLLSVAVTVIGLIVGTTNSIVGYYAWDGYGWTRFGGLISGFATLGLLVLNPLAWVAIPAALLGSGLLWLPAAGRFFAAWQLRRHPVVEFAEPLTDVYYGPLPRYR